MKLKRNRNIMKLKSKNSECKSKLMMDSDPMAKEILSLRSKQR